MQTDPRRSSPETDYRVLFESTPGLYLVLDSNYRVVAVTDAYLRATRTRRDNHIGRNLFEIFPDLPGKLAENLRFSLDTVMRTGRPHQMAIQKFNLPRPDSEGGGTEEHYWCPINTPVLGSSGRVEHIVHQLQEVTEFVRLKQREREEDAALRQLYAQIARMTNPSADVNLPSEEVAPEEMLARISRLIATRNQLEEQLRQSQKMEAIGRLAGGVAHDFNNLLTVILGYSGLLKGTIRPSEALDNVLQIEQAASRATALTTQLLAFSRKQVLQPRLLDLNTVVAGMQEFIQRLIGEDIALEIELDPRLPHVKADPNQLEQVIMNLSVNARDAMPSGGRLGISTRAMAISDSDIEFLTVPPGFYVVLKVSDTGEGMDERTRARIFEPFFTTKENGKGTGLGLSTVFGAVEQSGGTITVSSEKGNGATFTIFLPASGESAPADAVATAEPRLVAGTGTVLLVEDDPSLRRLMREILTDAGHTVLEAANGEQGLSIASQHKQRIDLLVTDVVMPGLSGPEMVEALQKERPDLMVLFMSGYDPKLDDEEGAPVNFLAKPFAPRAFSEKVGSLLAARKSAGG
jgi:signal transduction histidine kinase/CheY-like chemotaxis protein